MVSDELKIRVADEVWIALARLHASRPEQEGFTASEIHEQLQREQVHPEHRPGLNVHIHLHCVANLPPNSATYRMLYKLSDGRYRLFRVGDPHHPQRNGKICPKRQELPETFRPLLDWYETEYNVRQERSLEWKRANDPLLKLAGSGKGAWGPDSDRFLRDLRADWDDNQGDSERAQKPRIEATWNRLRQFEGTSFRTVTGLPFTYKVKGDTGVLISREGHAINRVLPKSDLAKAIARWPVAGPTDLHDLQGPSYVFALLRDSRILPKE